MTKKILIVDKNYGEEIGLDNCLYLFPSIGFKPKWTLDFKEHTTHHHAIVKIRSKLASFFAKEIYSPALGYSEKACERLFLNYGTLLIYVLSDRLLRLNQLLESVSKDNLLILDIDFEYNKDWTYGYLYYKKVEMDPLYNQWLIKRLMPEINVLKNENSKEIIDKNIVSEFYNNQQSLQQRILRNIKNGTFIDKSINFIKNLYPSFILQVFLWFSRIPIDSKNRIPIDSKNVNFVEMKNNFHSFFWPFGRLAPLDSYNFKVLEKKNETKICREDFLEHKDFVSSVFREMLIECQGQVFLPESSLDAVIGLLADQLPTFTTEQADLYCEKYLKELKKYKDSFFIADGTGGSTLKSLRMFACKELSIPVIGTQHSAWGGYLSNGPLVSELLIEGSDKYISFGWENQTEGEASWKDNVTPLPSPMLSELEKKNSKNRFLDTNNKSIIFCLGFLHRFPAIYNSFLRCDIVNEYLELIEEAFKYLTEEGFKVTVFLYSSEVAEIFKERFDTWKNIGKGNLEIFSDHEIRMRNYMQNKEIDDLYDAFIWDMPAGGFSESLACGKKSFSLFNEQLIKPTEEAKPYIEDLKEKGIFFNNGSDLASNLRDMISTDGWYTEEGRMNSLYNFKQQYFKTSSSWKTEWIEYLSRLK